jgi:hypothetical protein
VGDFAEVSLGLGAAPFRGGRRRIVATCEKDGAFSTEFASSLGKSAAIIAGDADFR